MAIGYQLKITIRGSKPPIWRRVIVPEHIAFCDLDDIIEKIFGWTHSHLYEFFIKEWDMRITGAPIMEEEDNAEECIDSWMEEGTELIYTYDFGDNWEHSIKVEKFVEYEERYPVVLKYKGPNMIEDCGGIWGYYQYLDILEDKTHPEYEERLEWMQGGGYPNTYDLDAINEELKTQCFYFCRFPQWRLITIRPCLRNRKTKKGLIIFFVTVLCMGLAVAGIMVPHMYIPTISDSISISSHTSHQPLMVAHRGLSSVAPQNSIPAVEKAIEYGYDGCEFDIHTTKDGKWVVIHDDTVDAMTDGEGRVEDFTLEEILELKLDSGNGIENYENLQVPTLEQVLEIIAKIATALLYRLNVPEEEVNEVVGQIKEKRMPVLFEHFEGYDVQATRKEACLIR